MAHTTHFQAVIFRAGKKGLRAATVCCVLPGLHACQIGLPKAIMDKQEVFSTGGGGRSNGPCADSLPLSSHFQGGGGGGGWVGLGWGGSGGQPKGGVGGSRTPTYMA